MIIFQTILGLLLGATILSTLARRANIPYPTLLALGGAVIAFLPGAPRLSFPPDLIMALFVAPVLLDGAYDTSLRDLKRSWRPVLSLVLFAVILTTFAVAIAAHQIFPQIPWAAAIALGALLAPPDAVAAVAVLRQVQPPHRIRMVLEGESLLNDGSSLLIYNLAVAAVATNSFAASSIAPAFVVVVFGSALFGWLLTWPVTFLINRSTDVPTFVIYQFVVTFAIWLIAERLGLSGVITIVVFALIIARKPARPFHAHLRVPSFAIWETVTTVLNVFAFTLIGLQIRPILEHLDAAQRALYIWAAIGVLAVVIAVRLFWVITHHVLILALRRLLGCTADDAVKDTPSAAGGLVIGWAGMRGIVTLAAAMALPQGFPYRDFIQLCAFVVVFGTLVFQGLTLAPLLRLLKLPNDRVVENETSAARAAAIQAALKALDEEGSAAAQLMKEEFREALDQIRNGMDPRDTLGNALRQRVVTASRAAIDDLRQSHVIGDEAYRLVESELDNFELSTLRASDA